MNIKNVEYIKDSLRYLGFGSLLNDDLEQKIKEQVSDFQLKTAIGHLNKRVDYTLYFRRSRQMDMYFFNRYQAAISGQNMEPDRKQTFYINKGSGITAREAFNLLEGRSVYKQLINKEGVRYNAWLKLDPASLDQYGNFRFRQFNDQYGYDLQGILAGYPIRELNDEGQLKQLIASLEKGNLHAVHFRQPDGDEKFYIHAQPQFKTIGVFDKKLQPVVLQRFSPGSVKPDNEVSAEVPEPAKKKTVRKEQNEAPAPRKRRVKSR